MDMDERRDEHAVRDYYDAWSQRYLESFGDIFQAARAGHDDDLISHVVRAAGITDGMRLLDAGCGVCGPSIRIARLANVTIDAITISPVQAELARKRVQEAGLADRITVHLGDFAELAAIFGADRFDRIIFLETLCHARLIDAVTRGCRDVLRPGGQVYVKDFYRKVYNDKAQRAWCDVVIERVEREFRLRVRDISELIHSMKQAGLEQTFFERLGFDVTFSWAEKFATTNQIDVFAGGSPIDWGDWYEVAYQKPQARSRSRGG